MDEEKSTTTIGVRLLICESANECLPLVNNHTCQSTDNVNKLERVLFIYLYPFIAALCVVGNTANLIVYNHHFLRSSTTIRMLAMKAVANTLNILSLLPMHISSLALLSPSSHDIPPPFYWFSLRYVLFFANVFSTVAIWLTAAVSIENCLLVVFPVHAKIWCTMKNTWASMAVCTIAALLLHAFNLLCREIFPIVCFDVVAENLSETYAFQIIDQFVDYEGVYYWCSAVTTICLPMVIMVAATVLINYHLVWARSEISRGAEQKRCVVRLSFVTALCHVVFEMPHLGVLAIAAESGSAQETIAGGWPAGSHALPTVSNFLAQINASIPFFVYFLCSKRFRRLFMMTIGGRSELDSFSTTAAAFSRTSAASYRRSEVVLLNNSRLSVGHLPLSTFNDNAFPAEISSRPAAAVAAETNLAPSSTLLNHSREQERSDDEANRRRSPTDRGVVVTCSESTNLLVRND